MTFGGRLKKLRMENRLSQKDVGDFVGVSSHLIAKWEKDERDPNTSHLKLLSELFNNVSIDFLLGASNIPLNEVEQKIFELMDEDLVIKWLQENGVQDAHSIDELKDMLKMIGTIRKMLTK